MKRLLLATIAASSLFAGLFVFVAQGQEAPSQPASVALPGAFQTLAVVGGRPGRYYCPVCDAGVNPGILLFFKDPPEAAKPFGQLLKKIDAVLAGHPDAGMTGCGVCLDDGGYRQALLENVAELDQAITRRDVLARRLKDLTQALELKKLEFGLGLQPEAQKAYGLQTDTYAVVIVYDKQRILAKFSFATDALDDAQAARALQAAEKLAADAQRAAQAPRRRR